MTSSSTLADNLARAAEIGLKQEAKASEYDITHNWWVDRLRGRVDEYHAFEKDYDLDDPVGWGATESAAIADLEEQIEERDQ
jgi:hypothetical protein